MNQPTAAGLCAMIAAVQRLDAGRSEAFLCPLRIGKNHGPAIDRAVLRKLHQQGFSCGSPAPVLTQAGIEYARNALALALAK